MEILADFAKRKGITFPLLSDPKSETIKAFGIFNTSFPEGSRAYGAPYPGTYMVDQNGVVQSKYFPDRQENRYTAPSVLLREFGSAAGTRETAVKTDHIEFNYYSTKDVVRPSLHFSLVADFNLKPKMHVYAPDVKGYTPIALEIAPSPNYKALEVEYPRSKMLFLPAIKETVPIHEGKFRIIQDVMMANERDLKGVLDGGREVKITGNLRYQACDDKICYFPQTIPLEWTLKVEPLDRERSPEAIQHKAPPGR